MREILFKAKREDNGEWVEGSLSIQNGEITNDGKQEKEYRIMGMRGERAYVIPETVCQYTGLKDKNGKKIFEGDIVESKFTKKPYPVYFGEYSYTNEYGEEDDACGWYNMGKGKYKMALGCKTDVWATIIGNIFDNPELLEVTL